MLRIVTLLHYEMPHVDLLLPCVSVSKVFLILSKLDLIVIWLKLQSLSTNIYEFKIGKSVWEESVNFDHVGTAYPTCRRVQML